MRIILKKIIASFIRFEEPLREGVVNVFIVNFEHISHLVVVSLSLTLNMQLPAEKPFKFCNENCQFLWNSKVSDDAPYCVFAFF